jgi:hypothetical protein
MIDRDHRHLGELDLMTDILLIALLIAGPGVLIASWLAFLNAANRTDASDLDERALVSPRRGLRGSPGGAFPV